MAGLGGVSKNLGLLRLTTTIFTTVNLVRGTRDRSSWGILDPLRFSCRPLCQPDQRPVDDQYDAIPGELRVIEVETDNGIRTLLCRDHFQSVHGVLFCGLQFCSKAEDRRPKMSAKSVVISEKIPVPITYSTLSTPRYFRTW